MTYNLHTDDVLAWAASYNGPKFHALLCDPPYEIGFMGKEFDKTGVSFRPETWAALAEHLYPGAYLMAFGGTRTWHRLACAIEDAGFEIRDTIAWVYGSGFPKSHNVSKAIDKQAGAEREVVSISNRGSGAQPNKLNNHARGDTGIGYADGSGKEFSITAPATELAAAWDGWGTALKPAFEPVIVARKPLDGTVAQNCVEYGAGALNIDGARIPGEPVPVNVLEQWSGFGEKVRPDYEQEMNNKGRWPANFILGDQQAADRLDEQAGFRKSGKPGVMRKCRNDSPAYGAESRQPGTPMTGYGDEGNVSRFFFCVQEQLDEADPVYYCPKASKSERDAGCEAMPLAQPHPPGNEWATTSMWNGENGDEDWKAKNPNLPRHNVHPTLKPIALARYLATLLLPPAMYAPRRLLVPFSGSGSEMIGAHQAGWEDITGIEMTAEYVQIAASRLRYWTAKPRQLDLLKK